MKFNPMALKDVKWKQFFIEKGERVGLGITVFLMVVILIVSLFLPDHGFLLPGPGTNAKTLDDSSETVSTKQRIATPTAADKPPPIPTVPQVRRQRQPELASRRLLPLALVQPQLDLMKLSLAHDPG